ncbi:LA_2168 family protein [Leptospira congkakensis]|uniref:LA_2168 family protein n=1 Tax=Leptospira congkakensis TaxID=2484932 RepID=UPI001ABF8428
MCSFALYLLFGNLSLLAVGVEVGILGYELFLKEVNPKKSNQIPGWDLEIDRFSQNFQNSAYLNRVSGESMFVGLKDKNRKEKIVWDLEIKLTTGKETGLNPFYLGKNHYIGYETSKFFFGVGRREHLFRPKAFQTSYDGGEGVFIEFLPSQNLTLQFFLWDRYSGAILFEKDRFHSVLPRALEEERGLSGNSEPNKNKPNHHRRHSFGLSFGEFLVLRLGLQYIELGSYGRHVKDSQRETKVSGADGDSLVNGNLGIGFDMEVLDLQFDFLWAKGNDRTNSKLAAKSGSIPVSGEALQMGAELRFGDFLFRSSHFLSDREERNAKNQIIRDGYVSFGSHPAQTPYLSQILQVFPSAAVTDSGYEKNFALKEGRCFGYLTELVFQFTYHQFVAKMIGSYFLPYKVGAPSDGRISFQKRDFEVFAIGEGVLELSLKEDSSFELGMGFSQVFLPESIGLKSNFGYFFGRIQI